MSLSCPVYCLTCPVLSVVPDLSCLLSLACPVSCLWPVLSVVSGLSCPVLPCLLSLSLFCPVLSVPALASEAAGVADVEEIALTVPAERRLPELPQVVVAAIAVFLTYLKATVSCRERS